jgi:hypothetical protein
MNYKTNDGLTFKAHTYTQAIDAIRKSSKFGGECTNEEYRHQFAKRYKISNGISLPADTPKEFIEALINCGYLLKT